VRAYIHFFIEAEWLVEYIYVDNNVGEAKEWQSLFAKGYIRQRTQTN